MSKKIAIDVDDTLYSFGDLAREVMCDLAVERQDKTLQLGAYSTWNEWRVPPDIIGIDNWMEVIDICHEPEQILTNVPFKDSVQVLTKLADAGYDLVYISTRAPQREEPTLRWLEKHNYPLTDNGDLFCTYDSKIPYVTDCQYLIDDRPKTLVEFVYDSNWKEDQERLGYGTRVAFGLHTEYNTSLTDVPRIKLAPNWKLLSKFLAKEGLLKEAVLV